MKDITIRFKMPNGTVQHTFVLSVPSNVEEAIEVIPASKIMNCLTGTGGIVQTQESAKRRIKEHGVKKGLEDCEATSFADHLGDGPRNKLTPSERFDREFNKMSDTDQHAWLEARAATI